MNFSRQSVDTKIESVNETEVKTENFDFSSKKFAVKPSKRMWSLQKSIVNITSRESNPIARQIMMHLSMSKDPLIISESKGIFCLLLHIIYPMVFFIPRLQ